MYNSSKCFERKEGRVFNVPTHPFSDTSDQYLSIVILPIGLRA